MKIKLDENIPIRLQPALQQLGHDWRVQQVFQTEGVSDWLGCFVIVSERKIRIRRP